MFFTQEHLRNKISRPLKWLIGRWAYSLHFDPIYAGQVQVVGLLFIGQAQLATLQPEILDYEKQTRVIYIV